MPRRTALVLLAPRADVALHDLRVRYFRNLQRRMTAHVTMLFPFRLTIDDDTVVEIAGIATRLRPFDATFGRLGRFRDDVVWLRPDPLVRFDAVSDAVLAVFPDCSPYRGAHPGRTLHLTVASGLRGGEADRLIAELNGGADGAGAGADAVVPIGEHIDRFSLMTEHDRGWRLTDTWPFGAAPGPCGSGDDSERHSGPDDQPAGPANSRGPRPPAERSQ